MRINQLNQLGRGIDSQDILELESRGNSFKTTFGNLIQYVRQNLSLAKVAFTGKFEDIAGTPSFASTSYVATAIDQAKTEAKEYTDEEIEALADVAHDGEYSSLKNPPVFGSAAFEDKSVFATAEQGEKADTALQQTDLVGIATEAYVNDIAETKVDKVVGKQLSTEDFTTADQLKLAGIESGAQVNVATDLSNTPSALAVEVGSSTGESTTIPAATISLAGVFLPTEKVKLAGIAPEATKNATDADLRNRATHTGVQPISSITGLSTALDAKVDKVVGKDLSDENFTSSEKEKLAGLESSHYRGLFTTEVELENTILDAVAGDYADVDVPGQSATRYIWDVTDEEWVAQSGVIPPLTGSQVKSLYESNPDTNAFTDTEKSKLAGVANGATANATNAQLRDRATHTGTQDISTVTGLQTALDSKVDVEAGKGLSSNDFTDAEQEKLTGISAGATVNSTDAQLRNRATHTGTQAISTIVGLQGALDARPLTSSLGTAAVKNVTTSDTDTSADKVVMSSNFGLRTPLGYIGSWNDIPPTQGYYYLGGYTTDKPLGSNFALVYKYGANAGWRLFNTVYTNNFYVQSGTSTAGWNPPVALVHSGNVGDYTSGFASTTYVEEQLASKANDSEVVKLSVNQTIGGVKIFSSAIVAPNGIRNQIGESSPSATGFHRYNPANTQIISGIGTLANAGAISFHYMGFGTQPWTTPAFQVGADGAVVRVPFSSNLPPTEDSHLTRKDYVDGLVATATWSSTPAPVGVSAPVFQKLTSGEGAEKLILPVDANATEFSIVMRGVGGSLAVSQTPTLPQEPVPLSLLNTRFSAAQRSAVNALDPDTATLKQLIEALQTT